MISLTPSTPSIETKSFALLAGVIDYSTFLWLRYRNPTLLLCADNALSFERGVQQRDPLGSLLFCFAIHTLIKKFVSPLNVWYSDDGTLGGKPDDVADDLIAIEASVGRYSLELNLSRCNRHIMGGAETDR